MMFEVHGENSASASAATTPPLLTEKRKLQFTLPFGKTSSEKRQKIPRAVDIKMASSSDDAARPWVKMPSMLKSSLGDTCWILGINVQTHDWLDVSKQDSKGKIGLFGWYTTDVDANAARLVQLGWAFGNASVGASPAIKTMLVKPEGFQIADRAARHHFYSHDDASQNGTPLADVLRDFMKDVSEVYHRGGRICAHNLEFDAGVIGEELKRCGLEELWVEWDQIARGGYSCMNPEAGRWLLECSGEDAGAETKKHILGQEKTLRLLGIWCDNFCQELKADKASTNARLTRLVYAKMLERAASDQQPHAQA